MAKKDTSVIIASLKVFIVFAGIADGILKFRKQINDN